MTRNVHFGVNYLFKRSSLKLVNTPTLNYRIRRREVELTTPLLHLVIYYEMNLTPTQMSFEAADSVPIFERESRAGVFGVEHLHVFWQRVLLGFLCMLLILRFHFLSKLHVFWEARKGCFKHSTVSTAQITPSQQEDKQSLTAIHAGGTGL